MPATPGFAFAAIGVNDGPLRGRSGASRAA